MKIIRLSKVVYAIALNAENFLNGLSSNVPAATHNAFLNRHGRVVATFEQLKVSEGVFWIVLESCVEKMMLEHLEQFIRLSRVDFKKQNKSVYWCLEGHPELLPGERWLPQRAGGILLTDQIYADTVSAEDFVLYRLDHQIPLQGIDYQHEMILNISSEYVSFSKGCFLGQELVAKLHHRSVPSKSLVVKSEDDCSPQERERLTSRTYDPRTRTMRGFVFVGNAE